MMGIKIIGCTYVYCDNQSMLPNTTAPNSKLKKSISIAYQHIYKGTACDEWRTAYICTPNNPADLMTKALSEGPKWDSF